jgi:hypothetical protein
VVRLDADVSSSRSRRVWMGGLLASAGTVASAVIGFGLVVAHLPLLIAAASAVLPFAGSAAAAYQIARSHRGILSSVQLALEQVLDRLEHGEIDRPTGLISSIVSRPRLPRR